jgi:hypothetical protein
MRAIGNTNLLAPIIVQFGKNRGGCTNSNIGNFKKQALNNLGVLRANVRLLLVFSSNMFEHSKFTTIEVKLNTKATLAHKLQPK